MEWAKIKRKLLRDPKTAREYEALKPQYELASSSIGLRVAKGWTYRQLAARAGVKQADVAALECMDRKPSQALLKRLAKALDAHVVVRLEAKPAVAKARVAKKKAAARPPTRRRVAV